MAATMLAFDFESTSTTTTTTMFSSSTTSNGGGGKKRKTKKRPVVPSSKDNFGSESDSDRKRSVAKLVLPAVFGNEVGIVLGAYMYYAFNLSATWSTLLFFCRSPQSK